MKIRIPVFLLLCILSLPVYASHIYGGSITYKYLGSFAPNTVRYEITLTLYEDCLYGLPDAINQDNPEFINFFDDSGRALFPAPYYDSMMLVSRTQIVNSSADVCNFPPPYNSLAPKACLQKAVFKKYYDLPINNYAGATYTAVVQRCCLSSAILNIVSSSSNGITFSATIPAGTADTNSGAIFKNDPFYYIHINAPLNYDASATDGDSLSYEFCTGYTGGNNANAKPVPSAPPFTPLSYAPPFSYNYPITSSPAIQIDARTGLITGTPTALGRYLVIVCCHEWRNGIDINTTYREVQMIVTDCIHGAGVSLLSVAQEQLKIYSNPSSVRIGFKEGACSILVTDVVGRTMYASTLRHDQNSIALPTNSWNTGMYIVRLTYPGIGKVSTKFVVE